MLIAEWVPKYEPRSPTHVRRGWVSFYVISALYSHSPVSYISSGPQWAFCSPDTLVTLQQGLLCICVEFARVSGDAYYWLSR